MGKYQPTNLQLVSLIQWINLMLRWLKGKFQR